MPYDASKLTKLAALKSLAEKIKSDYTTKAELTALSGRVVSLEDAGGEPNIITSIKVNNVAQAITEKAVSIVVPTKLSELANDSKYQTDSDVSTAVVAAVAAADHLKRKIVSAVDDITLDAADADQYIYMVPRASAKNGDKYDEYLIIAGALEKVGDWEVDLTGYIQKEAGKGLSSNDYTAVEKAKLTGIAEGATKVEVSTANGKLKIGGTEVTVYTEPDDVLHGAIATDAEVTEMLNEVFTGGQS